MLEQAKTPKKKRGWLWLSAGVLAVALLISPVIGSIYLQSKAGKLIRDYVDRLEASTTNSIKGNFYCLLPHFYEELPDSTTINIAIQWLRQAQTITPVRWQGSFLLGQAYCLKQEYKQAIDAFDGFLTRRPDNQLAKAEAGFAYIALAQSISDPQNAETYRSKSLQSLLEAGYSNNSFTNLGDMSFKQEKYQDAMAWYEISDSFSGLQDHALFHYALLQIIIQGFSPYADQIRDGMILELDGDLAIEPTDLFELSTGSALQTRIEVDKTISILYSNSQDAGILLNISEASKYCISIHALDKQPAQTQIGVDMDFETLTVLELVNGNGDWVQLDLDVYLEPGLHLLGIKLMNDGIVDGIDRNAYFGPVTIETCPNE